MPHDATFSTAAFKLCNEIYINGSVIKGNAREIYMDLVGLSYMVWYTTDIILYSTRKSVLTAQIFVI